MNTLFFSGSPAVCQMGQRVMVVGGGLTSAHIISIALKQRASHVTWVLRKHLQVSYTQLECKQTNGIM